MRDRRWFLPLAPALFLGCGEPMPTRAEAEISGNAGLYKDAPVCIEISWQDTTRLTLYAKDVCSDPIEGNFKVTVSDAADDPENDVYDHAGDVFLKFGQDRIVGKISSKSEEKSDDVAQITVTVSFE